MRLSCLFYRCIHIPYREAPTNIHYATERISSALYIYFEASDGLADWKTNLNFPAKPYRRMGKTVWLAHRGFLRAWKALEPILTEQLMDPALQRIVTVGYSHGAAIAVLCHEYIWFHRPDLREHIEGYGFGCPRVLWGIPSPQLRRRWQRFSVIRNIDDIVTHLPPALLGFCHAGRLLEIGERGKYSAIDAHRPENILAELRNKEKRKLSYNIPV